MSQKAGEQKFSVQEFRASLNEISVYSSRKTIAFSTRVPEVLTDESDEIH